MARRTTTTSLALRHARRGLSAAAEAAAGLLRSGEAGPSLEALERLTAAMPPQPVSIAMLQASSSDRSPKARLLQAQFLHRELTARRAHTLSLLYTMPSPLAEQPAVARLANVYWERLKGLLELEPLSSEASEREFAARMVAMNDVVQTQTPEEVMHIVDALRECRHGDERLPPEEQLHVDRQLDAIFLARIGMRSLLEHYVASETAVEGFAGIIEKRAPHRNSNPRAAAGRT